MTHYNNYVHHNSLHDYQNSYNPNDNDTQSCQNNYDNKYSSPNRYDDYMPYKPIDYQEKLVAKGIGSASFYRAIEESLPAVFTRQTASKAIGGLISPKTLSNLDALGIGPPVKIKFGTKVGYEKASFMAWLKKKFK